MRILAIHGIGHADARTDWQPGWREAMVGGLRTWAPAAAPEIEFLAYDHLFERHGLGAKEVGIALARLVSSGLFYGFGDLLGGRRGMASTLESVRWTAGMVAQWVALEALRAELRTLLSAKLRSFSPDLIAAHSLGSLIAYDTLRRDEVANPQSPLGAGCTLLSFGSQIGNPAVRATFGGRVAGLESTQFWWHLFNAEDDVFTTSIALPADERFRQVDTFFDIEGYADHDGAHYLGHPEAVATVWQDLAATIPQGRGAARKARPAASLGKQHSAAVRKSAQSGARTRALLVGIADYPDEAARLDGPVNDVFSVSAALQELGFAADDIRVVLNERATTQGLRERLKWLLADARPGDQLVFYFAGHGAQIPGYGRDAEVDRLDECLVPYDYDWSVGRAITDDEFAALYAQLPYEAQFTAILDCCHSGGMARAGGVRARGLTPPDDIRHRSLRWEGETQMWLPREKLADSSASGARSVRRAADRAAWTGKSGNVRRLGRATGLWLPTDAEYRKALRADDHKGPYTPILIEACREDELAYEYRHGAVAHGAFTHALCGTLRDAARSPQRKRSPLTFKGLIAETSRRIALVTTEPQHPQLQCSPARLSQTVPGLA